MKNTLKKITGFIIGILFCFIVLEGTIRVFDLGQTLHTKFKHYQKTKQRNGPLVLCLGDSVTAHSYPEVLNEVINKKIKTNKNITVVDGAVSGTNADYIVKNIDSFLNQYVPDVVVIMTGNNQDFPFIKKDKYKYFTLFKYIKSAKFIFFVWDNIKKKLIEKNVIKADKKDTINNIKQFKNRNGLKETKILYKDFKENGASPHSVDVPLSFFLPVSNKRFVKSNELINGANTVFEDYIANKSNHNNNAVKERSKSIYKEAIKQNPSNTLAYAKFAAVVGKNIKEFEDMEGEILKISKEKEMDITLFNFIPLLGKKKNYMN